MTDRAGENFYSRQQYIDNQAKQGDPRTGLQIVC
jgi:hypothetical protein